MAGATLLLLALPGRTVAQEFAPDEADREAVRQAVLDYVEGIYETSPERIERSVSPELAKQGYYRGRDDSTFTAEPMSYAELLTTARTYNSSGRDLSGAPRRIKVFDVLDRIATARLVASWGIDYLQLVKVDGTWKIQHILWQSHTPETAAATRAAMEHDAGA